MQDNLPQIMLSLIDLTSLNAADTEASILTLCQKAETSLGHVAAVCIAPPFVSRAKAFLQNSAVKVATVANFPQGDAPLETVISSIQQSIQQGAEEIDLVFPYKRYLAGDISFALDLVQQCKVVCGPSVMLKVILETGAFHEVQDIANASRDILLAGADFLKTSTGKIAIGATLPAATAMLMAIKQMSANTKRSFGFKASGGIRTMAQATEYMELASQIMGPDWINPRTFRLGASQLLDELVENLKCR